MISKPVVIINQHTFYVAMKIYNDNSVLVRFFETLHDI